MTPIEERALQFARTFAFENAKIVRSEVAPENEVQKFGTPNSTTYGQVLIHLDYPKNTFEKIFIQTPEEQEFFEDFIGGGTELRVVCSATDVIHHEFPNITLN